MFLGHVNSRDDDGNKSRKWRQDVGSSVEFGCLIIQEFQNIQNMLDPRIQFPGSYQDAIDAILIRLKTTQ